MFENEFIFENLKYVYVVFVDEVSLWWLHLLKRKYRHCYILFKLDEGMTWVEVNPMSNQLFFNVYKFVENTDYIEFVRSSFDAQICEVRIANAGLKTAPLGFFTCVEFVKRVIGIHDRFIITPYQLYKKIINCRKKVLT